MVIVSPIIIAVIILMVFLFLNIPVFISLLSGTVAYFLLTPSVPTQIMVQRILSGMESIPLLAVPFFICAGVFMNHSGVTLRVMQFSEILTSRTAGGLGQVNILLSTLMGGLSGSNIADAAMEAKMLVPQMERTGFSKAFSTALTATSAMITPLIPPGISLIIYGSIANVSIGKLFIAGIGPGLLLCLALMLQVEYRARFGNVLKNRNVEKKHFSGHEHFQIIRRAILPLLLPIIIIGGIRVGIFTPTEAGAVAVMYAIFLGVLYREINLRNFILAIRETVVSTASILLIIGGASAFAWILTREMLPQKLTTFLIDNISNKYFFLMCINAFLLAVGMFIEGNAAMIVLVPLLAPAAAAFGINEIQFAMIIIFNLSIGTMTPPMGTLMFVTSSITGCKIRDFIKESIPFYYTLFICLMLLTFIPFFSTFMVNILYGG